MLCREYSFLHRARIWTLLIDSDYEATLRPTIDKTWLTRSSGGSFWLAAMLPMLSSISRNLVFIVRNASGPQKWYSARAALLVSGSPHKLHVLLIVNVPYLVSMSLSHSPV